MAGTFHGLLRTLPFKAALIIILAMMLVTSDGDTPDDSKNNNNESTIGHIPPPPVGVLRRPSVSATKLQGLGVMRTRSAARGGSAKKQAAPTSNKSSALMLNSASISSSVQPTASSTFKMISSFSSVSRTQPTIASTLQQVQNSGESEDKFLYDWEALLLKKLFSKTSYNNDVRPAKSNVEPVLVTLELVLLQINDLIDKEQQIVISGFLKINWDDERLAWNPEQFGNIEWIVTSARNVWLPDIALINSDDVYAVTRDGRFPVTITSNGQILYVPAGKIHARCELDLRFFPFDDQLCTYRFESWVYAAELVQINGINFTIDRNHYVDNHQWEIRDSFVHTRIVNYEMYNFSRVEFFMLLRRKSLFFITYTIFPCLALSTLQIFSHMLPFTESERINFATTTLIAFSVFHVSIVEQMPQSSHAIPLLAIYIDALMCLIGLSLLECFLMMNWLSKVGCSVPNPRVWYYVVDRWGDYMMLGSNGTYWRRNYLRILEEVNAKEAADSRRKAYEQKRWTSTSRKHQENYIRKWSNFGAQTRKPGEIDALICLMNRWGYSFGGTLGNNLRHKARQANRPEEPPAESKNNRSKHSFRHVDEVDRFGNIWLGDLHPANYGSASMLNNGDEPSTSAQRNGSEKPAAPGDAEQTPRCPSLRRNLSLGASSSVPVPGRSSQQASMEHIEIVENPIIAAIEAPPVATSSSLTTTPSRSLNTASSSSKRQPSSRWQSANSKLEDADASLTLVPGPSKLNRQRQKSGRPPVNSATPSSIGAGTGSIVNFSVGTQQCETRLTSTSARALRDRSESAGNSANNNNDNNNINNNRLASSFPANQQQDKQMQLSALDDIRQLIDDVNSSLSSHTLRRECIGVWTTFITVIDRIMSLILMMLCILMPTYLFVIFPKPMDLTNLKSSQSNS